MNHQGIYLDNAATTRCDEQVASLMLSLYTEDFGNPSSAHRLGFDAEQNLRTAREKIAKTLRCKPEEIIFTSGGTESDNLALMGVSRAMKRAGNKIIISCVEHPAVLRAAEALSDEGFVIEYLPVDKEGVILTDDLARELTDDTILVSVMAVNNEIGSVQPLKEIGRLVKERAPHALFHTDAVQGYGKIPILPKQTGIDMLSVSAHKLHGPKGVGFLYVREGVRLKPLIVGGGQQNGLRSGTENVPGYCGMALAAEQAEEMREAEAARLYALRGDFCESVLRNIPDTQINGAKNPAPEETDAPLRIAPHIISLSVAGIRAEVLLHALEEEGIYVSAGSACAAHHAAVSSTLQAIGLQKDLQESTIRISFSRDTTKADTDALLSALQKKVPVLRRYRPR